MIYYFIADLTELETASSIRFSDKLVLKSVPSEALEGLKKLIKIYYPNKNKMLVNMNDFGQSYHEYELITNSTVPKGTRQRKTEDFRYFVLEEDSSIFNSNYAKAFALSKQSYFIPFAFSIVNDGFIGSSISNSFSELCNYTYYIDEKIIMPHEVNRNKFNKVPEMPKGFRDVDKDEILAYIELLKHFESIKEHYPFINKALEDFFLIMEISKYSVFKTVSYIACLELLLVDNSHDKLKPISKQLQQKLNLLNNQFEEAINLSKYIKGPDTLTLGKVLEVLYNYRSSIAHGDFIDFSKKLNILDKVSENDILKFLKDILKRTLIFALKNPKLISDLKQC